MKFFCTVDGCHTKNCNFHTAQGDLAYYDPHHHTYTYILYIQPYCISNIISLPPSLVSLLLRLYILHRCSMPRASHGPVGQAKKQHLWARNSDLVLVGASLHRPPLVVILAWFRRLEILFARANSELASCPCIKDL